MLAALTVALPAALGRPPGRLPGAPGDRNPDGNEPRGKLVLVPGASLLQPASRRNIDARHDIARATFESPETWIDGVSIGAGHRVSVSVFPVIVTIRNAFSMSSGLWNIIADGYYVIVALSPGRRTIATGSVFDRPREVYGYTYNLTVR